MAILKGGYPTYGQPIGIIMLECAFPRPPGDIGNARSFDFPVRYEILEGILATRLTKEEEPTAVAALIIDSPSLLLDTDQSIYNSLVVLVLETEALRSIGSA